MTICTYPGCNTLIRNTEHRCDRHPYPQHPRRKDTRPSSTTRGYDDTWRYTRRNYLARNPVCELQIRCNGDLATEVDHITPLAVGGERLDPANLQALCGPCHRWKTAKYDRRGIPKPPPKGRPGVT
jgi:5-methylcytosine-specific restriction protein A